MARKRKIKNQTELTADDLLFRALLSGEPITREMAMSVPAVSAAVAKITNAFAMTRFELYKEEIKDGKRKTSKQTDYRVELVNDDTNDTFDGFQFKKQWCEDALLGQGGYAYINRSGNIIKSLNYVECDSLAFELNNDPIFKSYAICCNGKVYHDFQFLKLIRRTSNGAYGKTLVTEVGKVLQASFEALKYQLNLTETGGIKKGFLQSERKLGKEELAKLREAWIKMYSKGVENVIVLNDGIKYQDATATPLEMQLNQIRNNLNNEISSVFGIYSDDGLFFKYTMQPLLVACETALNRDLLLESEKKMPDGGCFYFAADDRHLTRSTMKERYDAYKSANWLGLNEIRYMEDMEEIEGLDIIPMTLGNVMFDINKGQYYVPNTGEKTE